MSVWPAVVGSVAAITAVVSVVAFYFRQFGRIAERVAKLETDNLVFWRIMEPHLANIIHQDVAPRRDALVERFVTGQPMDRDELVEMDALLHMLLEDTTESPAKLLAAALLAVRVEQEIAHRGIPSAGEYARRREC